MPENNDEGPIALFPCSTAVRQTTASRHLHTPGVPPIPSKRLPIPSGVGAPTAPGGGCLGSSLRPPGCLVPNLNSEIWEIKLPLKSASARLRAAL